MNGGNLMDKDPFKEYMKQSEPNKRDKGYAWHTAIGLQAVDGLKTSKYLIDTAIKNIEGDISIDEAQELLNTYYEENPKEQCSVCGKNHNIVCINDNTTIKEFSYNYYIPKESGCSWSEDERYCVLVKWEDFKNDPETYIDNAFNKRKSEISKKTKVRP